MTTLVDLVATRLGESIEQLAHRVEYIADLAALIDAGALPQYDAGAFVIPLGEDGGKPSAATGMFIQDVSEGVGVVLYAKAPGDAKLRKAVPAIDTMKDLVVVAIAGWAPNDEVVGVFELRRGRLLSAQGGIIFYQLDFTLGDQLRIPNA